MPHASRVFTCLGSRPKQPLQPPRVGALHADGFFPAAPPVWPPTAAAVRAPARLSGWRSAGTRRCATVRVSERGRVHRRHARHALVGQPVHQQLVCHVRQHTLKEAHGDDTRGRAPRGRERRRASRTLGACGAPAAVTGRAPSDTRRARAQNDAGANAQHAQGRRGLFDAVCRTIPDEFPKCARSSAVCPPSSALSLLPCFAQRDVLQVAGRRALKRPSSVLQTVCRQRSTQTASPCRRIIASRAAPDSEAHVRTGAPQQAALSAPAQPRWRRETLPQAPRTGLRASRCSCWLRHRVSAQAMPAAPRQTHLQGEPSPSCFDTSAPRAAGA